MSTVVEKVGLLMAILMVEISSLDLSMATVIVTDTVTVTSIHMTAHTITVILTNISMATLIAGYLAWVWMTLTITVRFVALQLVIYFQTMWSTSLLPNVIHSWGTQMNLRLISDLGAKVTNQHW